MATITQNLDPDRVRMDLPPWLANAALPMAAILFSGGMLFGGFNYAAGDALLCLVAAPLLALILLAAPPPMLFWRRVAPAGALVSLAFLWVALPLLLPSALAVVAPDLLAGNVIGLFGLVASLFVGALLGFARMDLQSAARWLVVFGCLVALAGLLTVATPGGLSLEFWRPGPSGRLHGTLDNANVAGCYFGGIAVLALSITLEAARDRSHRLLRATPGMERRRQLRMFGGLLAMLLSLGACFLTGSRTAAALSGVAALGLLLLSGRRGTLKPAILGGAMIALAVTTSSGLLLERFGNLRSDGVARAALWSHALEVAEAAPVQGHGLGSYPIASSQALRDARLARAIWTANSAHNKPIQLIIEGGWPYLLLLTLAAILIALRIVTALHARGYPPAMLALASMGVIVVGCGLVDIALDVPALTGWMLFAVGLAWGRSLRPLPVGIEAPHRMPA